MMVMWVGSHFDVVQSRISKALRMSTTPEGAMRKMPIKSRVSVMPFDFLKTERPTALSGKRLDLIPPKFSSLASPRRPKASVERSCKWCRKSSDDGSGVAGGRAAWVGAAWALVPE